MPTLHYSPGPEEEEEIDTGHVADGLLSVHAALVGGIQGLEDGDGDWTPNRKQ